MSITREELKVGEIYISNNTSDEIKVLSIGDKRVFYKVVETGLESIWSIEGFLNNNSIIPKEPKKLGQLYSKMKDTEYSHSYVVMFKKEFKNVSSDWMPITVNESGEVFEVIK